MWTAKNRGRYDRSALRYPSDLTDDEWALVEPLIPLGAAATSATSTSAKRYFLEGRIKEIANYCETDVVNTYRVWLRYELFRRRLGESEHQASERSLADFLGARVNTKVHLHRQSATAECPHRTRPLWFIPLMTDKETVISLSVIPHRIQI